MLLYFLRDRKITNCDCNSTTWFFMIYRNMVSFFSDKNTGGTVFRGTTEYKFQSSAELAQGRNHRADIEAWLYIANSARTDNQYRGETGGFLREVARYRPGIHS